MHAILALMAAIVAGSSAQSEPCEPAVANRGQADVRTIIEAVYRGDAEVVWKYTHPVIWKLAGGEQQARRLIEGSLATVKTSGISIESFTFPSVPSCLAVGVRRFMVVPTLSVLGTPEARMESLNYQFGVLDPGAREWKYVEGSRVNSSTVYLLFPGFPKDYRFPEIYRKRI